MDGYRESVREEERERERKRERGRERERERVCVFVWPPLLRRCKVLLWYVDPR